MKTSGYTNISKRSFCPQVTCKLWGLIDKWTIVSQNDNHFSINLRILLLLLLEATVPKSYCSDKLSFWVKICITWLLEKRVTLNNNVKNNWKWQHTIYCNTGLSCFPIYGKIDKKKLKLTNTWKALHFRISTDQKNTNVLLLHLKECQPTANFYPSLN